MLPFPEKRYASCGLSWTINLSFPDQDLISRSGKFGGLYKRAGHRVIVNRLGDIICRPNPLEASLQIMFLQGNVQHHLLHAYLDSIVAVLLSQFTKKGELSGSMIKIVEIVRHNKPLKVKSPIILCLRSRRTRTCSTKCLFRFETEPLNVHYIWKQSLEAWPI